MKYKNVAKTVYKVSDLLSWQRARSLKLSPVFQRRSVWSAPAKSFLLDTVIRGLPIPIIILRERSDLDTLEPMREVVDGQQRLRTIFAFVDPKSLEDFNPEHDQFTIKRVHNKELARKSFHEFDPSIRRRILDYEFSVHVLPSDTEDREVLEIFSRLNSTGLKLNHQEIRNAKYFGAFKATSYNLAHEQLDRWRNWQVFSENNIARMAEVEETSDLILLMLRGLHAKRQPVLNSVYAEYEEDFPQANEVSRRFRAVMDNIDNSVGDLVPNSAFKRKALFHTLFTYYYDLLFGVTSELKKKRANPLPKNTETVIEEASRIIEAGRFSEDLAKALRGATNDLGTRKARLEFLRESAERVAT